MKTLFFEFLLYVYLDQIVEDWDVYTKLGKIYYYPFWFIRSILVWVFCPIFLIPFFIKRTEFYRRIQNIMNNVKV